MSRASLSYRAHVPCRGSLGIDREPVAVRICARLRWRAHSGIKNAQTPPAFQSVACHRFGDVISAVPSPRRSRLRTALEHTRTLIARTVRIFVLGPRTIFDFCRRFGSGKPSFLPLVQACKQASGSVTQTFRFPPIGALLSPAVHGQTMQHKDTRDHGNSYPQHG